MKTFAMFVLVFSLTTQMSFAAKARTEVVPDGAKAKCKDGTYSYSPKRSGTCSGHKGVSKWY